MFRRKKTATQPNRGHEPKKSVSAISIRRTPGDHRVAHVAIRTGNHQFSWRVPWRRSPLAPVNKQPGRPACQKDAGRSEQNGDPEPRLRGFRKCPGRWPSGRNPEYGARDEEEARPRENDDSFRESHVNSCWRLAVDTPMLSFVAQVRLVRQTARSNQALFT